MIKLRASQKISGVICSQIIALTATSACTRKVNSHNTDSESLINKASTSRSNVRNSVPEWYAFAVFHPESSLAEDNYSFDLKHNSSHAIDESMKQMSDKNEFSVRLVLGAKSLIPILRSTFGNQARSSGEGDENSWFTTHPSDLFTPSELSHLCHSAKTTELESTDGFCWKPRATQQYLLALTDFASDACTKLVELESKNDALQSNKIFRNKVFSTGDLKHFVTRHLKIDKYAANDEWLNKIVTDAEKFISEELQLELPETDDAIKVHSVEKAIFSCRAALTSEEFYTR
ncbi:MAG: hypothetical protein RJB13_1147 [Pseudomonadota bacterium]